MAPPLPASWTFEAIGVPWRIDSGRPVDAMVKERIQALIERFDAAYSRFRSDSLVSTVAAGGGRFEFPADAPELFDLCDRLHRLTDGAVDPLVGRQLERLGYDATYTLTPRDVDVPAVGWERDVRRAGRVIETDSPMLIDIGAVGKGYLVDQVSRLLTAQGFDEHVVDASGDLRHRGGKTMRVGLEHPRVPGNVIGTVDVYDAALCASSVTRRAWRALHHVLDARTGVPTRDVVATWVLASNAAEADGLATALFFADPRVLAESFEYEFVRMRRDHVVEVSARWPGDLFVGAPYLRVVHHSKTELVTS